MLDERTMARLKLMLRRDPLAILAAGWLVAVIAVTLAAPWLPLQDPTGVEYSRALKPPSASAPLGTDNFGRDILTRVMYGGRASLTTASIAVVVIIGVSVLVGAAAGYVGGWLDVLVSRVIDVLLAFPRLVLAIAIAALMGASLGSVIVAVTVVSWPSYARIFRSYVLQVKHEGYVVAARCAGTPTWKILTSHILGAIVGPVLVLATLDLGQIILSVASLSFLGLGIRPPAAEWGAMLNEARPYVERAPWVFLAPGVAIFMVVMSANYLGDAVRDAMDPRAPRVPQLPSIRALLRLDRRRQEAAERRVRLARLDAYAATSRSAHGVASADLARVAVQIDQLCVEVDRASHNGVLTQTPVTETLDTPLGMVPDAITLEDAARSANGIVGVQARLPILRGVSLTIRSGECIGIVGESGSGKSTLAAALMGLLRPPLSITAGTIRILGEDTGSWTWDDWRPVRGRQVTLVNQDPLNALNPLLRIGDQLRECLDYHDGARLSKSERQSRITGILDRVRLSHSVLREYPHQLSGGMRQRVVIAMALINQPQLVIADEPTTALDVTTQARILEELAELQRTLGVAMIFISHDLRIVAKIAERVVVMRNGEIVEEGPTRALFKSPQHPYTKQLPASVPEIGVRPAASPNGAHGNLSAHGEQGEGSGHGPLATNGDVSRAEAGVQEELVADARG